MSAGDAPVLVFQGTRDPLVPTSQVVRLMERLTAAGVPGRIEFLLGAGHGWQEKQWERAIEETFEFFDEQLKTLGAPGLPACRYVETISRAFARSVAPRTIRLLAAT